MDHDALKIFLHLTETLHFGKTSRACNTSPSALSRQIQRMEDEVGQKLFERNNRKVLLTEAGLLFRDYARSVLAGWQTLMNKLMDDKSVLKGEISIYCSVTASLSVLPGLLKAFRTSYPDVHIRLQTGDAAVAIRKVLDGETDIAVSALPEKIPGVLNFKILTETSLVFIAPKIPWAFSHALKENIVWKDIPMILSERGLARKKIDAWFKKQRIQPNIYAQVSGNEAIMSMVRLGCGIGIVPKLVVEKSPLKNSVLILALDSLLDPYTVGICVQKRKMNSPLIRAFWEIETESR
jgi:LysR family positive regulator for ilvC